MIFSHETVEMKFFRVELIVIIIPSFYSIVGKQTNTACCIANCHSSYKKVEHITHFFNVWFKASDFHRMFHSQPAHSHLRTKQFQFISIDK